MNFGLTGVPVLQFLSLSYSYEPSLEEQSFTELLKQNSLAEDIRLMTFIILVFRFSLSALSNALYFRKFLVHISHGPSTTLPTANSTSSVLLKAYGMLNYFS
jgi:hypothetical protein